MFIRTRDVDGFSIVRSSVQWRGTIMKRKNESFVTRKVFVCVTKTEIFIKMALFFTSRFH